MECNGKECAGSSAQTENMKKSVRNKSKAIFLTGALCLAVLGGVSAVSDRLMTKLIISLQ